MTKLTREILARAQIALDAGVASDKKWHRDALLDLLEAARATLKRAKQEQQS